MAVTVLRRTHAESLHPLHAAILAGTVPLFLGALLNDVAYALSYEVQWKNFASWLIAGGLVFAGFAMLWAFIGLFRAGPRGWSAFFFFLLLATWVLGFINALVHAMDAWEAMPEALLLSAIVAALAIIATGFGFNALKREG
ncbi:DUF2231 domain-containing protein [Rhodoplanes sp. Z2-YC6860]|uniref:DUF2231 domain-containing protein n=1 Tax=Rhodoplanes sp. Z2-YC6860 TaxID=674703 RepID=UPI00078DAE4B|nr:DUF2231 domain-containing protein [Rhodoplanes sp. Z2-YC6860]AMN44126.1 succinate dehydrogenase cytochrome b subunit family protein [Rhodoplanes sp. Z2-YC6860]